MWTWQPSYKSFCDFFHECKCLTTFPCTFAMFGPYLSEKRCQNLSVKRSVTCKKINKHLFFVKKNLHFSQISSGIILPSWEIHNLMLNCVNDCQVQKAVKMNPTVSDAGGTEITHFTFN